MSIQDTSKVNYSAKNIELQQNICELLGLRYEGIQHLVITLTLHGTVEVDTKFYAMKEVIDEPF